MARLWFILAVLVTTTSGVLPAATPSPAATSISHYLLPDGGNPDELLSGADGSIWFAGECDSLGELTTSGTFTMYDADSSGCTVYGDIIDGPDGNIWIVEYNEGSIVRIGPDGTGFTRFTLVSPSADTPVNVATGPDGNLWITMEEGFIVRLSPAGTLLSTWKVPWKGAGAYDIVQGADGNMWFTDQLTKSIGRVTQAGEFTKFRLPAGAGFPYRMIRSGSRLWYQRNDSAVIGRVAMTGVVKQYRTSVGATQSVTAAPSGGAWFVGAQPAYGRITRRGVIRQWPLPRSLGTPNDVEVGPDKRLWISIGSKHRIVAVTPAA